MSNSIKTAHKIRSSVFELAKRLYKTTEGVELAEKYEVKEIISELLELSQEMVLESVTDVFTIDSLY